MFTEQIAMVNKRMTREELKQKLYENGSIGLDFSPGNQIELEAYWTIIELEKEIKELKSDGPKR